MMRYRRWAVVLAFHAGLLAPAGAVDVSSLSDIEADPCFQQVRQRELDHQLGAIESQIVAACTDAHGNPTDAMALLTERMKAPPWLPPAASGRTATAVLLAALAQLAVVVALLSVRLGYAPRALGLPAPGGGLAAAIVAARLLAALLLTALLALPGLVILAAAGMVAIAVRACRWRGPVPAAAPAVPEASARARIATVLGTDLLGNAAVTVAIAALSRGSPALAAGGVLAGAAVPRLLHPALTRHLVARPALASVAGALVAWTAGEAALSDPALAAFGPAPLLAAWLLPAALVVLAVAVGRRAGARAAAGNAAGGAVSGGAASGGAMSGGKASGA